MVLFFWFLFENKFLSFAASTQNHFELSLEAGNIDYYVTLTPILKEKKEK
jgi:hypothetical protein